MQLPMLWNNSDLLDFIHKFIAIWWIHLYQKVKTHASHQPKLESEMRLGIECKCWMTVAMKQTKLPCFEYWKDAIHYVAIGALSNIIRYWTQQCSATGSLTKLIYNSTSPVRHVVCVLWIFWRKWIILLWHHTVLQFYLPHILAARSTTD